MSGEEGRAVLLDTHLWVWYVENDSRRFSRRIEHVVERAALRESVLISIISVWEVALLEAERRLQLSDDVRIWTARALRTPGVRVKELSPGIAIESTRLPGNFHRDPADRILVATARLVGATLVTRDERMLAYGQQGYVRVLDATP